MGIEWSLGAGPNGVLGELLVATGYGWRVAAKVDAFPTVNAARDMCVLCLVEHRISKQQKAA